MVKKMNFEDECSSRVEYIERVIRKYLPEETGFQRTVLEAMNYSMLAGGKRIRPMLMLETYRLFEGKQEAIVEPFMAAMEMIHTYSLVHDDLPAMDNDEYRRGRKTTHVVYGEAMGILAGDGLLNYAYETACKAFDAIDGEQADTNSYKRIAAALRVLAVKPGISGMLGGQVVDVLATGERIEKERLDFIYRLKTGALIEGTMMIGALLAGANDEQVDMIEKIGADIGLAFQIQDDILDVTSTVGVLGKPIHSDEKNNKTTYVTLLGIEKAKDYVASISHRAVDGYSSLGKENVFLKDLILQLVDRKK